MLIRFVVNNVYSFGSQKEFNMIPNSRLRTLEKHKYNIKGFELLKMASIYGANGAGKSNLIKSIDILKRIILNEGGTSKLRDNQFKFISKGDSSIQTLAIEFIQDDTPLYYGIEVEDGVIKTEELYISGLGKNEDKLIFERKTENTTQIKLSFTDKFEVEEKTQVLKQILIEEFIKPNEPILKLISNRENEYLYPAKLAIKWFRENLQIITPDSQPIALAHRIDVDSEFKKYAEDIMCSFHVGITSINTEKKEIHKFFGEDNDNQVENLIKEVEDSPSKMVGLRSRAGMELILVKESGETFVKQLMLEHKGKDDQIEKFNLSEESDGTIRLLDFIPAFQDLISKNKVFLIDEIERSIHPLLIKELLKKFSSDEESKGQLIFTTHESNLLDQDLFRQDEIWFAEKDKNGLTDLYSLSDFKEHKTIDIRKGYLNGRYGSIPFLANLHDLNWHRYDTN